MESNDFSSNENVVTTVLLVGLITRKVSARECEISMDELERLVDTAGGKVFARTVQTRQSSDMRTCVGKGKLEEIKQLCAANEIGLVVFDDELTPSQIKNIEDALDGPDVIDRTMLILDIFALHARSSEGKLQVELAQLYYTAPRLIGKGRSMSRLGGTIGTRGPGESKLETDRRHLARRIDALRVQLADVKKSRDVTRATRQENNIKKIAIVGYTNAGKSTLLNYLTNAGILAEDKLFATLDPTTRRMILPSGRAILLTDTVGFIRRLPHQLVNAFRSTLEEAKYADAVIIVIDSSDLEYADELEVTEKLLYDLGISGKPTLYVFNKCDIAGAPENAQAYGEKVFISAKSGMGTDTLIAEIEKIAADGKQKCTLVFGPDDNAKLSRLYGDGVVEKSEYTDGQTRVVAVLDEKQRGIYSAYIEKESKDE